MMYQLHPKSPKFIIFDFAHENDKMTESVQKNNQVSLKLKTYT
jgi:hypothetical protein